MSNDRWILTISINGLEKKSYARGSNKSFKYMEDKNINCEVTVVDNSVIIKKTGKIAFECVHKKNCQCDVKVVVTEGNNKFDLDCDILTNELLIKKDKIYLEFVNNGDMSKIEYDLKECNEF